MERVVLKLLLDLDAIANVADNGQRMFGLTQDIPYNRYPGVGPKKSTIFSQVAFFIEKVGNFVGK